MGIQGVEPAEFTDVVLSTLEFRTTIATLLLAAYGFIAGRAWLGADVKFSKQAAIALVIGGLLCALSVYFLGQEYVKLGLAMSRDEVILNYATLWLLRLRWTDWALAASAFLVLLALGLTRPRTTGGSV